jgi:hypothetical protein
MSCKNLALNYEAKMHPSAPNISPKEWRTPGETDQAQLQAAREKQVIKVRNQCWTVPESFAE